jgi:glycosyltransferase involved in cell wall biosynthesis
MMMSPALLIGGMTAWHLSQTAREFQGMEALRGYWVSNSNRSGIRPEFYQRVWPYHASQKIFYHLPFGNLEEKMRWWNLPFYDAWMRRKTLPTGTNVVQGPMGSCDALFNLAERSGQNVLKVFDSTNSHPTSQFGYWQRECDIFMPGYKIPVPQWVRSRINREIARADVVLCPSDFVKDTMVANGVPEEKCFTSHFGVNVDVFKRRKIIPSVPRFICVGGMTLRKGQQYLFRAFEIVKTMLPDAELICVGGVRPDFVREMRKWQGSFIHYPSVSHSELARLLADCTAFVLPSLEEGFARVLSEAMAVGLPVLASYESGATTVVRDGVEGIIIRPHDIRGIADSMLRVAKNIEENLVMGEAAYLAGAKSNSWTDYAKRLWIEYSRRLNGFSQVCS